MSAPEVGVLSGMARWWRLVGAFLLRGRLPRTEEELPVWSVCVPALIWHRPCRAEGTTFQQIYSRRIPPPLRPVWPGRALYLLFLWSWPLLALLRLPRLGRAQLGAALTRPDLCLSWPEARYSPRELAWMRPDHLLGMVHAWTWACSTPAWMALCDKERFDEAARSAGLPLPRRLNVEEAQAEGGLYIVKDPGADRGRGVELAPAAEVGDPEYAGWLIQERLQNHPALLQGLPPDLPLCTLRVLILQPPGEAPRLQRAALRLGRPGALVDNAAAGGLWFPLDRELRLRPGLRRSEWGRGPPRHRAHPDGGRELVGWSPPLAREAIELALEAHRRLCPGALAVGWDLALCPQGPLLIELNAWAASYDADPAEDAWGPTAQACLAQLYSTC